jgi:uncharacterized protein (TIGR02271 family)
MTTRTVTAMFNSRAEAERAAQQLATELSINRSMVRISPEAGATDTGVEDSRPYQETGFWASLKDLFLPEEDRHTYAEGLRRGGVLVSATVDESQVDRAADVLEGAGAVDLDQQEASWRQSGWSGYDATAGTAATTATSATTGTAATAGTAVTAVAGTAALEGDSIPVIEERLVVGKREVDRGRVRVRSYVVERAVEEQVRLRDEHVAIERRPVDRPLTDADADAFKERVIEATAVAEEAVVGKEARVVEEIAVHKDAADRTETVRDTLRRTEVEVEGDAAGSGTAAAGAAGTSRTGTATTGNKTGANPPGTAATRAADRALGTDMSGAYPQQADGTPENPPGTMASRAVDKTLGTNISGTNRERK